MIIAVSVLALIYALAPNQSSKKSSESVSFSEVQNIINKHCVSCHASEPSSKVFAVAPGGFMVDTKEKIIAHKNQIYQQAVVSKAMPLGNSSNMTDEERDVLRVWAEAEW